MKTDFKGKKITIMGLGVHGGGVGAVRFLSGLGAKIIITDLKSREELASSISKISDLKNITYIFGQHRPEDFSSVDMVVKNPAVPWSNKYIKIALEKNIPVEMDSSLFFNFCPGKIIGVTGTKGKTTTAALIYEILKKSGQETVKVGVGQVSVLDKIKDIKKETLVVFELSSWRLSALGRMKISPEIAIITNVFPDHLNYYKSMERYIQDKKCIFINQKNNGILVLNRDNAIANGFEKEAKGKIWKFSREKNQEAKVYIDGGSVYFNNGIDEKKIIELSEIKMTGRHNQENVLAATAAALSLGVEISKIKEALEKFSGVPHRLETVGEINGIKYINDTTATTPEAAMAALDSFSEPVVLLAGGSDKNLEMKGLAEKIMEKTKAVVFFKGVGTEKIILEIKKRKPDFEDQAFKIAETMEDALELARAEAQSGDVVLLSPGAASFGMFQNEFDRGEKFREAVNVLKEKS